MVVVFLETQSISFLRRRSEKSVWIFRYMNRHSVTLDEKSPHDPWYCHNSGSWKNNFCPVISLPCFNIFNTTVLCTWMRTWNIDIIDLTEFWWESIIGCKLGILVFKKRHSSEILGGIYKLYLNIVHCRRNGSLVGEHAK